MSPRYFLYGVMGLLALFVSVQYALSVNLPLIHTAGPVAAGEWRVMVLVVEYAAIVVVPVWIMLFLFAWMFREGSESGARTRFPDIERYGSIPEMIWWGVPTIVIGILSVVSWQTSHSLDPYEPVPGSGEPLEIQVIALDWKWLFIYPSERIAAVNELRIPVGRPIHFSLTAQAPMNSFWIPQLAGQVMVMPGMSTQLWLRADRVGVFDGYSANLSGEGFASMNFKTHAVTEADFARWIEKTKAGSGSLDVARYAQLTVPSSYVPIETFSPVVDDPYQKAIDSFMMPGTTSL